MLTLYSIHFKKFLWKEAPSVESIEMIAGQSSAFVEKKAKKKNITFIGVYI